MMLFSYFPTKLNGEDPKKDLTIDGDSFRGTINFYLFIQNMCYNW
jgi:hypothetical protein